MFPSQESVIYGFWTQPGEIKTGQRKLAWLMLARSTLLKLAFPVFFK